MDMYWLILFFVFGTIFGSFFNVVGLRVPKQLSFHQGRSYCPSCKKQLHFYELIPILSYLFQKGKCRKCKKGISPIYPIIELLTGFLFAYSYINIGWNVELIMALCFMSMLMILFVSDVFYLVIPNKVLLFFLPIFIGLRVLAPLDPWYDSIVGGVVGYVLIALIIIVSKGGMGAGDMKLFGVIGVVLGVWSTLLTFFLAAFLGAIVGGILMLCKIVDRKQPIPFGPYIVVASIITYFYGEQLIELYVKLL